MDSKSPITRFRGEYKFLSNFFPAPFDFEGIDYLTSEHAYQERKTVDPHQREWIRSAPTAMESARRGRDKGITLRDDWFEGDTKAKVMEPIVREKFQQNPDILVKLLETGDRYLMEGNYWHDNYFGVCTCKKCHEGEQGQNWLGRILMKIREEFRRRGGLRHG